MELPLRTERLLIRLLTPQDIDEHHRMFSMPEVIRYLYDEQMDRAAAVEHLGRRLVHTQPTEGAWFNLAVEADGRYLGEVGLHWTSAIHRQVEVGYVFLPEGGGQGLATEAVRALVDVAFRELNAHRICGCLDARNLRSAALLRRLGMRQEAHLRENEWVKGEWTDESVFAITRPEWEALRG